MDVVNFAAWEGRTATEYGCLSEQQAAQLHVTLGGTPDTAPQTGDAVTPLGHWCAFAPLAPNDDIGADGHPRLGDFLPPVNLPRRMWAGGSLSFHAPMRVGDRLTRSSTIMQVAEKGSLDAPMVFVTVQHDIYGQSGLAVRERQTLVYLPIPETYAPPPKRPMLDDPDAHHTVSLSEPTLFRFSAVTFNAHRIHYDLPYAQSVEKYPGLVIHGPLQAMHLMRAASDHRGRAPSMFEFRGVHPMFLGAGTLDVMAKDQADGTVSLMTGQDGHQGMTAHAIWEETQ